MRWSQSWQASFRKLHSRIRTEPQAAVASTVRLSLIAVFMGLITLFSIDVEWAMPEKLADFSFGCLRRLLRNPVSGSFK